MRYLLVGILSLFGVSLSAEAFLPLIEKPLRAEVNQAKHLKGISFTIKSKGDIIFMPNLGVIHRLDSPIKQTTVYGKDGLRFFDQHQQLQPNRATDNKIDQTVSEMLLALLNGNTDQLAKWFTTEASAKDGIRHITFFPKTLLIKKALAYIKVEQDTRLRRIEIKTAQGDLTVLVLNNYQMLSEKEIQLICSQYFASRPCSSAL